MPEKPKQSRVAPQKHQAHFHRINFDGGEDFGPIKKGNGAILKPNQLIFRQLVKTTPWPSAR